VPFSQQRQHDSSRRSEWFNEFVQNAGVQFLINLATEVDFFRYDPSIHGPKRIHDMCIATLYKIVNNFYSTDVGYAVFESDMHGVSLPREFLAQNQRLGCEMESE
jgi:hypothetical protein